MAAPTPATPTRKTKNRPDPARAGEQWLSFVPFAQGPERGDPKNPTSMAAAKRHCGDPGAALLAHERRVWLRVVQAPAPSVTTDWQTMLTAGADIFKKDIAFGQQQVRHMHTCHTTTARTA